MKTSRFFMVCIALVMSCQVALFAQEAKKNAQAKQQPKRPTPEQWMTQIQCNRIIKELALDDATAAKFTPVYKNYQEEMRALRKAEGPEMDKKGEGPEKGKQPENGKQPQADKQPQARPMPTDAEVEAAIKERFAQSRKLLDIRENYYNEFRKILSPKQIQRIYDMEKGNGDRFRKELNRRQNVKGKNRPGAPAPGAPGAQGTPDAPQPDAED